MINLRFRKGEIMQIPQWHKIKGTILLTGETGTGKSYLAKEIHHMTNPRSPFIEVNLATLQDNLLESELFGYEKGAFTGAHHSKFGFLDKVGSGILFFDEIAELSLSLQKKLLGLLEEKNYYPVGSTNQKKFLGQIIVATNRNLEEMVKNKTFREDLYFRLKVFTYEIPPLRTNENHCQLCLDLMRNCFKRNVVIDEKAMDVINSYDWPGNVRELKHALEYALTFCDNRIELRHLPKWVSVKPQVSFEMTSLGDYYEELADFERKFFTKKLEESEGKINLTARCCGLSKVTLLTKLKKYEINNWAVKAKFKELKLAS